MVDLHIFTAKSFFKFLLILKCSNFGLSFHVNGVKHDNGVKHKPITVQLTENRLKKPAIATILTEIRDYLFLGNWVTTR